MKLIVHPHKARKTDGGAYVAEVDWCKVLSTKAHRSCGDTHCPCQCHRTMSAFNYGKDGATKAQREARLRKVKRIG